MDQTQGTLAAGLVAGGAASRRAEPLDLSAMLLCAPIGVFLFLLFLLPMGYVLYLSVSDPGLTLEHYRKIFSTPVYTRVMLGTFKTSLIVTALSILLGYPLAYVMATRNNALSLSLMIVVGLSFWSGFVVRTYAWLVILGANGPVASAFKWLGADAPPKLLFNAFSSIVGMLHILLPFMVFSLYSVMKRIDLGHLRTAASLGARPWSGFTEVFFPLSLPGMVNGSVLVFTSCLGFYITPMLLGSPRDMMISQLIDQQIEELLAWGTGSALAVVLLVATLLLLWLYNRVAGLDRLWG
ncbi:MAG TPA: ABC transporter permease [Bordetella sp.]|jgi:putative spermidine/putrescine transport system permease protein|nr:ABC transporter permease [Bordetella sp.]